MRKDKVVTFRLTEEYLVCFKALAEKKGLMLSQWIVKTLIDSVIETSKKEGSL